MRTDKLFHQERSTAESRVEFEARFYRELAEKTPGLMCCHDWDGVLLWINPAAAQSLGYTEDEVLGSRLDTFLSPPVRFLFPFYLERMRRKRSDNGLMRVQAKRGDERIWMYRSAVSEGPELRACVLGHAMDATDQVQAETALRGLFHNIPVGQMEFDLDGGLRRINPAACKLLGHSELELLCRTDHPTSDELLREIAAEGESPRLIILKRKDGRVLHLEVHIHRVPGTTRSPGTVSCALIDVSDRVRAEMKIRNLNAQLEARVAARTAELRQSNSELQEFAFIASHDLQAPLKQVAKRLEQLALKFIDRGSASVLLSESQADIQRMSMLIDSLLSFAVASNRTDTAFRQVPLSTALEESLMNLASTIAATDAVVTYEGLPQILVNESDFVQLFQNLVGNAIKYRSKERPAVRVSAIESDEFWTISVEDNGIGIDPAYSERIFEAFRRLHGKEYAGSGIGLAICKKIVERAGGRIWVESQTGKGSIFRFTIPN